VIHEIGSRRKTRRPVNTGIMTAFSRVSDVLDSLFTNRYVVK
jgi:hypothetical protein